MEGLGGQRFQFLDNWSRCFDTRPPPIAAQEWIELPPRQKQLSRNKIKKKDTKNINFIRLRELNAVEETFIYKRNREISIADESRQANRRNSGTTKR